MDASLGGWAPDDTNGLARTFAGTSIRLGTLAADGKAAQMPNHTIALDALEALEIHADLPAQLTFDDIFAILDGMHNFRKLLLGQVFGPDARVDIRLGEDIQRVRGANAVDITQRDIDAFIRRNFYSNDACHK